VATFTPPTSTDVGFVAPASKRDPASRLARHLAPHARGINVYKLTTGAYTEDEPTDPTTIAVTYHGGHSHTVSAAEAALLTAAGYAGNIT